MKKKDLILSVLIILIAIIISFFLRMRSRDIYFYPSYIPQDYKEVKPENDVIAGSLGIGFVTKFESKDKEVLITTYKESRDIKQICGKGDVGDFTNVELYKIDNIDICSYNYQKDDLISKQYYLLKKNKLIRIYEKSQPYLNKDEINKIILSLSVKYR